MKRIFVCSPLRASDNYSLEENRALALRLCKAVCKAGHAPFAPHVFYTQILDDNVKEDRLAGINCGLAWMGQADEVWVYASDIEQCSDGMRHEVYAANRCSLPPTIVYLPPEFERVEPRKKNPPPPPRNERCLTCEGRGVRTGYFGFVGPCDVCDGLGRVEV